MSTTRVADFIRNTSYQDLPPEVIQQVKLAIRDHLGVMIASRDDRAVTAAEWALDGGGCLMNQGIHDVDLFTWFLGDVEEVIAITETYGRDIEVETLALALIKFKRGPRGHLEGTTLAYPEFDPYIEAYGSRGTVAFSHSRLLHMEIMDLTDEERAARDELIELTRANDERKAKAPKVAAGTPVASLDMGHAPVVADFVDAIRTDRKPFVTSHDARKAVSLIRAIYESGRSGSRPVQPA